MAADTTDEVAASGQAIAEFIDKLGEAVAAGQGALDKNTAFIAQTLSKTKVQVPSLIQEVIDDTTGIPTNAKITYSDVPMSTIVLPMAYQFSRVFFQADLKLSEIDSNRGIRLVKSANALKAAAKVDLGPGALLSGGLPGVNAGGSASISSSDTRSNASSSTDQSIAILHFEATLEPRREVQVPQPLRSRSGPRITVAVVNMVIRPMTASVAGAAPVPFVAELRTATVNVQVFKANGAANDPAVPNLSYSADAPDLAITVAAPVAAGAPVILTVVRTQTAEAQPLPPLTSKPLRVTLGAVTETIMLSI
jgi:hypothetical protein